MSNDVTDSVLLASTLPTASGQSLGILTLNRPKALNSLNLELITALRSQLLAWQQDANIVAIWLQGSDKALCAGGDIRELQQRNASADTPNTALQQASDFFSAEYGLYAYMARYSKPIITWCGGIVMGGGLGLAAASSVRIVTETTLMAMPEISIGLFPDAGADWFLQRFPFQSGVFLGLTGSRFNGSDALLGNLAAASRPADSRDATLQAFVNADWQGDADSVVRRVLNGLDNAALPESQIMAQQAVVQAVVSQATFQDALTVLAEHAEQDAWLAQAHANTQAGCPTSMGLIWRLLRNMKHASLADCIAQELIVSQQCCTRPDFLEGVRALLIDKDKNPQWVKAIADVDKTWLDTFFIPSTHLPMYEPSSLNAS